MSEAQTPLTVPKKFLGAPGGFNPTVALFLAGYTCATLSVLGFWCWNWPHWLSFVLSVTALHLVGTVIHDASHNVAHANRILNAILGHGSALLLGFTFPVFTRVHLQHHAHVNDPKNDPDHIVSTFGPLWLIAPRFFYHEIYFFQRRLWKKFELLEWFLSRAVVIAIFACGVKFGFLGFLMNYWLAPALVVGIALGLFFDYLPHRPFQERNRWRNARVYPGQVMNILIMGQNYHLIHHLWPSIPWYLYRPAYHATKPLLDKRQSPQTLGILASKKDFWNFIYDVFIGIRIHRSHETQPKSSAATETDELSDREDTVLTTAAVPASEESREPVLTK
ncbi:beta-carotene hydroxylase [Synechococcus elongatus]|uniref:Beta-carotene hydroxylase n=1 Tax=Synechococcus elongatus PCC 11802 TaxID=2283154 RepID=A0AAU6R5B4_SYNEL|nr:fatty acid desaturase [Synechococcus elongatus]QFZ91572.1 beta-carotene hydroxylase [Synechococcus elongatus PCC 11802]